MYMLPDGFGLDAVTIGNVVRSAACSSSLVAPAPSFVTLTLSLTHLHYSNFLSLVPRHQLLPYEYLTSYCRLDLPRQLDSHRSTHNPTASAATVILDRSN